jgi:hypothetical protein
MSELVPTAVPAAAAVPSKRSERPSHYYVVKESQRLASKAEAKKFIEESNDRDLTLIKGRECKVVTKVKKTVYIK